MENGNYFKLFFNNENPDKKQRNIINTQLFDDFHTTLQLYSYSFNFNREDARDVVFEFFLNEVLPDKQYKHFYRIAMSEKGNLKAYIFKCFKNHCIKVLQKKKVELAKSMASIECQSLQTYNLKLDNSAIIDWVLSFLPDRQRHAVYLRIHGFSHKEILSIVGVNASVKNKIQAIKNLIYKGMLTLKKLFKDDEGLRFLLCN